MIDYYYKHRDLITPENLIEIRFEDLNDHPLKIIEGIYDKFDLKGFEQARPAMEKYLQRSSNIQPNHYQISPRTVELVNQYLLETVKRWNYEVKD